MGKRTILTMVVVGLLISPLAAACGMGDDEDDNSGDPVPETVMMIEEDAEDAIDMILVSDWEKVQADAQSIDQTWTDFLDSSQADDVTDDQRATMATAIDNLSTASAAQDNLAARQAANDVSKIIIDVFDLFDTKIPADIGRLDYLERQVIIDSERGDWSAVQQDIDTLRDTFERVKPSIVDAGGAEEADDFAASIETQQQLGQQHSTEIINEANVALELVDSLESVY
jgi:hypothetical protein